MATGWLSGRRSPLLDSVGPYLERLPQDRQPDLATLNALVAPGTRTGGGKPLRFVPPGPASKEFDALYEVSVHRTGGVPTRDGSMHDLFNALAWLAFPATKAALNRLHHAALIERGHASGARGTARDVLTLFDEGGVIVASGSPGLLDLVRRFAWKELFWQRRDEVLARMRFFVLGHAIMEKALEPYKSVTAKALLLDVPDDFLGDDPERQRVAADRLAASWLESANALRSSRALPPLPVMGVPGWSEGQDAAFYDDAAVFRPGYLRRPAARE